MHKPVPQVNLDVPNMFSQISVLLINTFIFLALKELTKSLAF